MKPSQPEHTNPPIRIRPLSPSDWPNIENLFGKNGACGGCWCMWWRVPRGGKLWAESKGEKNRRALRQLITTGKVHGCLAFADDLPVGWCCVGPRRDFPRTERSNALKSEWDEKTWSVTCFFIRNGWRNQGISSSLLRESVKLARSHGAKTVEGYPIKINWTRGQIPGAFAYTGLPQMFERQRFVDISLPAHPGRVLAKKLRPTTTRRKTKRTKSDR
jgi:GNAT superfamily N-acetyltransferase